LCDVRPPGRGQTSHNLPVTSADRQSTPEMPGFPHAETFACVAGFISRRQQRQGKWSPTVAGFLVGGLRG
jgi:hypothetical protein